MTINTTPLPSNRAFASGQFVRRRSWQVKLILVGLLILLILSALAGVGLGAVSITSSQIVSILGTQVGFELPWAFDARQEAVVMAIRLPRVILGIVIGAAFATSGAALQGLFRNPLAAPSLIGISSGAALGATIIIVRGSTFFAEFTKQMSYAALPLAAFLSGILITMVVYRLSLVNGRTVVATMLLAGIAINALAGAGTGVFG